MPYFKRRLYSEANAPPLTEGNSAELDFLKAARDVLSLDAGDNDGPFRFRGLLRPGGRGVMVLDLALDNSGPPVTVSLAASNLVGPVSQIPENLVHVSPSTITLFPDAPAEVEVTVSPPPDARPGLYTGTLSAAGDETFIVVIELEVG